MGRMLNFFVATKTGSTRFQHHNGPIEFGRKPREGEGFLRHVLKDPFVSGDQLRVVECLGGRVRLVNLSQRVAVAFANGDLLEPGSEGEYGLPVRLTVGESQIEITPERPDEFELGTIAQPVAPGGLRLARSLPGLDDSPSAPQLTRWFEAVIAVQRAAASSEAFYRETARAVVELVGLDFGLVLMRRDGDWRVVERHPPQAESAVAFSRTILERVCQEKRTFFQTAAGIDLTKSLVGVSAVVASPIFSHDGATVVGAVYGTRSSRSGLLATEIRPIEAQLVQVLATAVGAGLARIESEAEAIRQHVQFEQFFSQELARELDRDPTLLEGRDRVVTILISDIRGFSRIAERIGPRATCDLIVDAFERLTARIQEQGGVVVDYLGDGLIAMWNAPIEQPDHGLRACRAALAMLAELPELNARWQERIGAPLQLGIGLNTGAALVGNTGCRRKFKYGPLGHTVNLASRVEGATKQLGVPILITGSTHQQLDGALATRRLGRFRVVGIAGPVELHELHAEQMTPALQAYRDTYERALALFEAGQWSESYRILSSLISELRGDDDFPTLTLASRAIDCLRNPNRPFEPVVELSSK
jgi:adenylate cyclase